MSRPRTFLLLVLPALAAVFFAADWWICLPAGKTAHYVGREQCARCHPKEMEAWAGSDHDRSMDLATPETVLGNFADREFTHHGVTSKFFREGERDEKFYVTTDGPEGQMETYRIKYVFGVRPLQQYLVEFPDGRVQCLGIAWDTEKKRWFHLYPQEIIPAGDELHWTRRSQNWNHMCAECHSTKLQKNYELKSNTFNTTFSEIDVSCETCHGPGSLHVEAADSFGVFWDRRYGYALPRLKDDDSRVEIETCAPCHARREIAYPNHRGGKELPKHAGQKLLDYYIPELLDRHYYYADGQILEEDYVYGSFIQSKMYAQQVRCSDCHDPHTARVKFDDNRLCTTCHAEKHPAGKYDTPAHHFHPDSSKPGTLCVECHMAETLYMVVDPRRDHSMRSPRPDLTISLGIPNACNGCHHDESKGETPEWAEEQIQEWYGKRDEPTHFAHAIAAGRQGKPEGERALEALTRRKDTSAMVRASALLLWGHYQTRAALAASLRALEDPEELVRVAAVRSLASLLASDLQSVRELTDLQKRIRRIQVIEDPQEQQRQFRDLGVSPEQIYQTLAISNPLQAVPQLGESAERLAAMLTDPIRAVRTEAARVLGRFPERALASEDREAFDAALAEYIAGQESFSDHPAAHMNLGIVYNGLGQSDKAERAYLTAIRIGPRFLQARINLAMLYSEQGKHPQAAEQYRDAIALEQEILADAKKYQRESSDLEQLLAETHYSLGLLLAEDTDRLEEAAEQLAEAVRLAPQNARMHYNYGLALQHLGKRDEAEGAFRTAYKLAPAMPDYLHALTILYAQQERWARAIKCAEELADRHGDNPQMQALLKHIRQEAKKSAAEDR